MTEDFNSLSSAVDRVGALIAEAVDILKNPQTDNNDQSVIDALTIRLNGAADALQGLVEPAVVPATAPEPATADGAAPEETGMAANTETSN